MNKSLKKIGLLSIVVIGIFLPDIVLAADFGQMVERGYGILKNKWLKPVCIIAMIGIAIYWIKNHEQTKQVGATFVTIFLIFVLALNADNIANWLLTGN